ncbi:MAG TPA: toll/interleukin-1 receptor domain-containing protein [Thermoanaerobaculia bacterium]|jgi:hypothetical protein|nr:toll/interleukin-1 receptor domain-containing protein [Thermoanaerobaculia bacterium]
MRVAVRFFNSYAHADQYLADDLILRLQQQMTPSRAYEYTLWRDTTILVGELWFGEIVHAVEGCDMGLLFVSPAFLGSGFIDREELPRLIGQTTKPIVPVMLRPVSFERHDLKGLSEYQIYRLDQQKSYSECNGDRGRSRFVEELFLDIERRLDRILSLRSPGPDA